MIFEWIEYFRTPASEPAKKFGHLEQSIALGARAQRQSRFWKTHLDNCHQVVREQLKQKKSILILGSGHLFDLPPELFDKRAWPLIEKVFLLDLVHPRRVRAQALKDSRIELLDFDISCGLTGSDGLADLRDLPQALLPAVDLVISANLMSQLPLPWTQKLDLKMDPEKYDQQKMRIETQIVQNHWDLLQAQKSRGAQVLFWTDFEKRFFDRQGVALHTEGSLGSFVIPGSIKTWTWDIAPIPEISKKIGLQMQIACGNF